MSDLYLPILTEINDKNKEKISSLDKALACIFVQIEKQRKKKRFIIRREEEKIHSIVQILWPLTLLKISSDKMLVFDSTGNISREFYEGDINHVREFRKRTKTWKPHSITSDEFLANLKNNSASFKEFKQKKSRTILGCFPDDTLISEIGNLFKFAKTCELVESIQLPIIVDGKKVNRSLVELEALSEKVETEIHEMTCAHNELRNIIKSWREKSHKEIDENLEIYQSVIDKITPEVNKEIRRLESSKEREIATVESRMDDMRSEVQRWESHESRAVSSENIAENDLQYAENDLQRTRSELDNYLNQLNYDSERDYNYVDSLESRIEELNQRVYYSNQKLEEYTGNRRETSNELENVKNRLNELQNEQYNIENQFGQLISTQDRRIESLREERASKNVQLFNEVENRSKLTKGITDDIKNLIKTKQSLIDEIENMSIPITKQIPSTKKIIYAFIPFFVVWFTTKKGARIMIYPPLVMTENKSVGKRIFKFLSKTTSPPADLRDESFLALSSKLNTILSANNPLAKDLVKKAGALNLLNSAEIRKHLHKGIEELYNAGKINIEITQTIKNNFPAT